MILSYDCRLACLALFGVGLMQWLFASLLRLLSPVSRPAVEKLRARWMERIGFVEAVASHLAAFALVFGILVPQYIRNEVNLSQERVGLACIAVALGVAVRYAYALARAIGLIWISRQQGKTLIVGSLYEKSFFFSPNPGSLLAVAGFLSPKIILSRSLLGSEPLSPDALEIALAHEQAHLRQFDNLKLLILSSLSLPYGSASQLNRWRRAAEIAADEDAVAGCRPRAILLAETLLRAARATRRASQATLGLGLLPHEEDLVERIHRLLDGETASFPTKQRATVGATLLLVGAACILLCFAIAPFSDCAEYLLHLG
jgi:hypothetical protein